VIRIPRKLYDEMMAHAKSELPNEGCGYLAGVDDEVKAFYPMTNVDASPVHFAFDPKEQFKVLKEARAAGLSLISVYHSHPDSPARLSQEDYRLLKDRSVIYIIVAQYPDSEAPRPNDIKGCMAYRIIDEGESDTIEIKIED